MSTIWNVTLKPQNNPTSGSNYTCSLVDIASNKRLRIRSDDVTFTAVVQFYQKTPQVRIAEISMKDHTLRFEKNQNLLIPANIKKDDTWLVSARKNNILATITFRMKLTAVSVPDDENPNLSLNVKIALKAKAPFTNINEQYQAYVSLNREEHFKPTLIRIKNKTYTPL